jgi:GAF domain-containing protein/tetratricopeptide (TPR) repeat protein
MMTGSVSERSDYQAAEEWLRRGALQESLQLFHEAFRHAEDPCEKALVLGRIAWVYQSNADLQQASSVLGQAFRLLDEQVPNGSAWSLPGGIRAWVLARRFVRHSADPEEIDQRRLNVLCELHSQNARLAFDGGSPLHCLQSTERVMRVVAQLEGSPAAAKGLAVHGCALAVLGRKREGFKHLDAARRLAKGSGDDAVMAYCLQLHSVARYWSGAVDEGIALTTRCLERYGDWLEANEFYGNVANGRTAEAIRGRPLHELAWVERAVERVCRDRHAPAMFSVVEKAAHGLYGALGWADGEELLRVRLRGVRRPGRTQGVVSLMLWPARIRRFTEVGDLGRQFETLVGSFGEEGHDPRRAHPALSEYYVHVAHARAHQCLRAAPDALPRRVRVLRKALDDLGHAARLPLVKGHVHAIEGCYWFCLRRPERARRHLLKAKRLAEQETCPWVLYAVARAEAHLLRGERLEGAALAKAHIAVTVAEEHGAVHRARFVREEFGLGSSVPVAVSPGSSGTRPSGCRRHLRTLLELVRDPGLGVPPEVHTKRALRELVQVIGGDRAMLLLRDGTAPAVVVAEEGRSEECPTAIRAVVEHVRWTGQAYLAAAPVVNGNGTSTEGQGGIVVVPLILNDEVYGALGVERNGRCPSLEQEDLDLLELLAPQVLSVVQIARLLVHWAENPHVAEPVLESDEVQRWARDVAHGFRNALMVIELALESLSEVAALDEEGAEELASLRQATERLMSMTRDLERSALRSAELPSGAEPPTGGPQG